MRTCENCAKRKTKACPEPSMCYRVMSKPAWVPKCKNQITYAK